MEDDINQIFKESSIQKWNGAEFFCYFLFMYLSENKPSCSNRTIQDIEITHHNYWGSQKSDLQVKFTFNETYISQTIYIESKQYANKNENERNNSIENSVKEFTKKRWQIEFWDSYMVFIPWQQNLNKALWYIHQRSMSKDMDFPRHWFQISQDIIWNDDSQTIQTKIKDKIWSSKKIDISMIRENYEELKNDETFISIAEGFWKKISDNLDKSFQKYIEDNDYENYCYKNLYEKPDLTNHPTATQIIDNVINIFTDIIPWEEEWKNISCTDCKMYLLQKFWYQKYQHLFQKIESYENEIYTEIENYLIEKLNYKDRDEFNERILASYQHNSNQKYNHFKGYIVSNYFSKRWLFYVNWINQIKIKNNWSDFIISKQ